MSTTTITKKAPPKPVFYFLTASMPRKRLGDLATEKGDIPWLVPITWKKDRVPEGLDQAQLVTWNAKVSGMMDWVLPDGLLNALYRIGHGLDQRFVLITFKKGDKEAVGGEIPIAQVPELIAFGDFPHRLAPVFIGQLAEGVDISVIHREYAKKFAGVA